LTAVFVASLPVVIPLYFCMAATGTLPKCKTGRLPPKQLHPAAESRADVPVSVFAQ
jgi:hypothetical protein